MDVLSYLTTSIPDFDALDWVIFILQIGAALAGGYLAFIRADAHVLRGPLLRRLGYALLALGGVGTLAGVLRLAQVFPFTARYWLYVVVVFEVVLAAYALFYWQRIYPLRAAALAETRGSRRPHPAAPRPASTTNTQVDGRVPQNEPPRPASTRRESRRDRKRRKR